MKIKQYRHGAIVPLFAVVLPVMLILCFIAMNLSFMQLTETELKIATDAAARAGGRAWSTSQDIDVARDFARRAAELNTVSGHPLVLDAGASSSEIVFGTSTRGANSGRYEFIPVDDSVVANGATVSGVQVFSNQPTNLLFKVANITSFNPSATSVSTQVDRDIALVIDRSISMAFYEDSTAIRAVIADLKAAGTINEAEATDARRFREFSPNVLKHLSGEMLEYAISLNANHKTGVPIHSRWSVLETASEAFFQILRDTDQIEQVSICSFSNDSRVDLELTSDMTLAEDTVKTLFPNGSTAIGDGLLSGLDALTSNAARQSAATSIILFTDGVRNGGVDPDSAVQQVLDNNPNTVIHTVTFTEGADQVTMKALAKAANGQHFHANTGDELVDVFEEIAASLPTIITQ